MEKSHIPEEERHEHSSLARLAWLGLALAWLLMKYEFSRNHLGSEIIIKIRLFNSVRFHSYAEENSTRVI